MRRLILACVAVVFGGDLGEEPPKLTARDVGFSGWGAVPEKKRVMLREKAGWKWDFPNEPPEYRARQEMRKSEILQLKHYQERVDNWVQYTQTRTVKNFTRNGFDVVKAPADLVERLRKRLFQGLFGADEPPEDPHAELKGRPESRQPLQGIYGDELPLMVHHGEGRILDELRPIHEAWAPGAAPLQGANAYGMRVYRRGASLAWHADRVDSHIISSILHVGHSYDDPHKPWPIEIEGHDGRKHAVSLQPGEMLLYESAKCPHGRSTALEGDYYASVFVHFQPVSTEVWPYTHQEIWLAVPPGWDAPPLEEREAGERWAGAFLTHDNMAVANMAPRTEYDAAPPEPPRYDRAEDLYEMHAPHPDDAEEMRRRKLAEPKRAEPKRAEPKSAEANRAAQAAWLDEDARRLPDAERAEPPRIELDKDQRQAIADANRMKPPKVKTIKPPKAPKSAPAPERDSWKSAIKAAKAIKKASKAKSRLDAKRQGETAEELEELAVGLAGLGMLGYCLIGGGAALIGVGGLAARRAYATRGRSLMRYSKQKVEKEPPGAGGDRPAWA